MSAPIELVLPMPPNATNRASGRSHWRVIHKEKAAYLAACDALQATGQVPPPPAVPFTQAHITSVMYLGGAMDDDNALARHKSAVDWLRTRGYLATDRRTGLRWAALPDQVVKRDGNYRIHLTITPLDAEAA